VGPLFRFIFKTPLRAALACGLLVAVVFGLASYPSPELRRSVSDWRIQDVLTSPEQQQLLAAYEGAQSNGEVVSISEEDFRDRGLAYSLSLPLEKDSGRQFLIRHIGMASLSDGRVYVAEREILAAPWWSPHRFVYKAAVAEVDAFGEVLELTFERDVLGLAGLIILDGVIGAIYGVVIGLIVAVVRNSGLAPSPKQTLSSQRRRVSTGPVR
jgi:hypothetical protein